MIYHLYYGHRAQGEEGGAAAKSTTFSASGESPVNNKVIVWWVLSTETELQKLA